MREKLSELMKSLLEFWQDPQPGLFTWKGIETQRLQKIFDLLWEIGFRSMRGEMAKADFHELELRCLGLPDNFEGDLHTEMAKRVYNTEKPTEAQRSRVMKDMFRYLYGPPFKCPECEYEERTGETAPATHTCDDPLMDHYVADMERIGLKTERGLAEEKKV